MRRGALVGVTLVALLSATGSGAQPAGRAAAPVTLTGLFNVKLTVVTPKSARGRTFALQWTFVQACDTGQCGSSVSTAASSCVAGQCAEPPSALSYSEEPLAFAGGLYKGTFTVKTSCTTTNGSWPYGYRQHTVLALHPTAAAAPGVGVQKEVKAFSGTLSLHGDPAPGYRAEGCLPYDVQLKFTGTQSY